MAAGSCDKETSAVLFHIGDILPSLLQQALTKYKLSASALYNHLYQLLKGHQELISLLFERPRWRRKRTIHSKERASYLISSFTITMANPALFLCLLFCFPFESIGSSTKTGLVVLGGDSAELWTPVVTANFEENKTTNNGSKYSGKEITFDSCTLPPPPSPMYGHSLDLVDNNTIVLVHGDFSYNLNSNGWTKGPNTIYNR